MFTLMKCQNIETVFNPATNEGKEGLKCNWEAKNVQVLF